MYADADDRVRGAQVRVLEFGVPAAKDRLAANQFTVVENRHERRPDIVLFVNGLPLAIVGLKNPAGENATIHTAFKQLQTYKAEIPSLFALNAALYKVPSRSALRPPEYRTQLGRDSQIELILGGSPALS